MNEPLTRPCPCFFFFAGVLRDLQLLLQRAVEGAAPAHHRLVLQGAQLHRGPRSGGPPPGQPGAGQRALAAKHLHLQPQDLQGRGGPLQARRPLDQRQQRDPVLAGTTNWRKNTKVIIGFISLKHKYCLTGHPHHFHLPDEVRLVPAGHPILQVPGKSRCSRQNNRS